MNVFLFRQIARDEHVRNDCATDTLVVFICESKDFVCYTSDTTSREVVGIFEKDVFDETHRGVIGMCHWVSYTTDIKVGS
jgi:hypothetical protein